MEGWIAGYDKRTITFFIEEDGKLYSVIFDREDECWECECGNLICDHMKMAFELKKKVMI